MCSKSAAALPPEPNWRKRHSRRTVLLLVGLLLVGVLALVAGLASTAFVENLAHDFDMKAHTFPEAFPSETLRPVKPNHGPAAEALNMLLLGSDRRGAALTQAKTGEPAHQRSNTIMWVHVSADRQKIYLVSIMRDMWAAIAQRRPGSGVCA